MRLYGYRKIGAKTVFVGIFSVIVTLIVSIHSIKIINSLAKTVAVRKTTEIMNTRALEHISKTGEVYNAMLIKEKNSGGSVSAVEADILKLNLLQTDIAEIMTKELNDKRKTEFCLSLANLLGYNVISDKGVKIPVEFAPITRVETRFDETFVSAGINQTLLTVNLEIIADMRISVFPFGTSQKVVHTIPIAKTVIVGDTPSGFYRGNLK